MTLGEFIGSLTTEMMLAIYDQKWECLYEGDAPMPWEEKRPPWFTEYMMKVEVLEWEVDDGWLTVKVNMPYPEQEPYVSMKALKERLFRYDAPQLYTQLHLHSILDEMAEDKDGIVYVVRTKA